MKKVDKYAITVDIIMLISYIIGVLSSLYNKRYDIVLILFFGFYLIYFLSKIVFSVLENK